MKQPVFSLKKKKTCAFIEEFLVLEVVEFDQEQVFREVDQSCLEYPSLSVA